MKSLYQILMPLLSLFLVRVELTDLFPLTKTVTLIRMIDADTYLVKYGNTLEKVRLSKIDAPEKGQPFLDGKGNAAKISMECAQLLFKKKTYELKFEKRDLYGRILGDLDEISFALVERGCVSLYPHAVFKSRSEKDKYRRALMKARHEHKGVWKLGGYLQPKKWRKISKQISHRPKRRRDRPQGIYPLEGKRA